jgi:hypothetical protein
MCRKGNELAIHHGTFGSTGNPTPRVMVALAEMSSAP